MADEMANSMEKMKLTSEEEEVIEIFDEGRLEALESCNLSLIGKFVTCKPFNKMVAKNMIRSAWGVDDALEISKVGPNQFQFEFQSEFEMDRILRGGPWSFDNQLLMLQRWKKGMTVGNIRMVRVALPISKPLKRGGFIAGTDGGRLEEVGGNGSMKQPDQMVPSMMVTVAIENSGKPSEHNKADFVKVGVEAEVEAGITHVDGADHANMNELESKSVCPTPNLMPILKGNAESHTVCEEELMVSNVEVVQTETREARLYNNSLNNVDKPTGDFGPLTTRPNTTWTCINRMDFGLEGLDRAITLPSLGKRDVRETSSGQFEEHEAKRRRVLNEEYNFIDILAGVNNHPCREQ
uniref:DUF4283 domain-containing protein n=1 Tax=Quercus lobata TaxID=97700 RepID=A0A7N2LJS9_QUELO